MLELLGEFDADDGFEHFDGCGTTARWLAWACSMSPGAAREHVRIARALLSMPLLTGLFREGRISYSKVRAATWLAGQVDEAGLCELVVTMTAAQLDQTVSGYRAASGSRMGQQERRRVSWSTFTDTPNSVDADHVGDDADGVEPQMVSISARLPVEEAAVVIRAMDAARDRQPIGERDTADALVSRRHRLGDELVEEVLAHDRDALAGVGEQQQRVPGLDAEQLTCPLGDHDLPLLADLHRAGELPGGGG